MTNRTERVISMRETAVALARVRSNQPRVSLQQAQAQAARLMAAARLRFCGRTGGPNDLRELK